MRECLAPWYSAWVAPRPGQVCCHRQGISPARLDSTMLCTGQAAAPRRRTDGGGAPGLGPPAPPWPAHPRPFVFILPSPPRLLHLRAMLPAPPSSSSSRMLPLEPMVWAATSRWQLGAVGGPRRGGIDETTLKFWEMREQEYVFGAASADAAAPGKAPDVVPNSYADYM